MSKKKDEPEEPKGTGLPTYDHKFAVAVQKPKEENAYQDVPAGFDTQQAAEEHAAKLAGEAKRKAIVWHNYRQQVVARYGPDGQKVEKEDPKKDQKRGKK